MTADEKGVVFVTQHYPPDKGGNATRIHDIATHLGDDWKVTVLAPPPSYPPGTFERSWGRKQTDSDESVTTHRLWTWQPQTENPGMGQRLAYYLLFGLHAMVWLLWNVRRYDIVVTTTPPISTGAPGFLARFLGKSWVVDVRDRWIDASISLGYLEEGSLIERLSRRFQRLVLHTADRIAVTTPVLGEAIQQTYGASLGEKTVLVPNGVDVRRFQTGQDRIEEHQPSDKQTSEHQSKCDRARKHQSERGQTGEHHTRADRRRKRRTTNGGPPDTETGLLDVSRDGTAGADADASGDGDEVTLIYTGNLGSAQDLESVIRAMRHLPEEVSLLLVGGGDVESELRQLTDDLGLQERVEFAGVVPREDVPEFLNDASLGIAPLKSTDELAYAIPTKVYEYMASGLPTVVTGRGEIEQFVDDSGGGVHVENDPEHIARRLDELLEDDQHRRQLAERGQEYVETNYDRKAIARRFGDELRTLLKD